MLLANATSGMYRPEMRDLKMGKHTVSGTDQERDAELFETVLGEALEQGLAVDAAIASSKAQSEAIWAIRDDGPGMTFQFTVSTHPPCSR